MSKEKEEREKENHHIRWAENIRRRNARYDEESNWWPFVENVEEILARIDHMTQRFDDIDNYISSVDGKIKNLRKILIKLEIIDDRFIF